jgi:hypothetical protein
VASSPASARVARDAVVIDVTPERATLAVPSSMVPATTAAVADGTAVVVVTGPPPPEPPMTSNR